jgi:hypothetical protein
MSQGGLGEKGAVMNDERRMMRARRALAHASHDYAMERSFPPIRFIIAAFIIHH